MFTYNILAITTQPRVMTTLKKNLFENIVGKGENAGNQHFLLCPRCFLPYQKEIPIVGLASNWLLAKKLFKLAKSKILWTDKGFYFVQNILGTHPSHQS